MKNDCTSSRAAALEETEALARSWFEGLSLESKSKVAVLLILAEESTAE